MSPLLLLTLLLLPVPAPQSPAVKERHRGRAPDARSRSAPASAPAVLEGGRRSARVLVIALHGGSWVDPDPARLAARCCDALSEAARGAGVRLLVPVAPIVSTPDSEDDYQVPWLSAAGEALVLGIIDREVSQRRADPDRISLAGHGAGAAGALLLAARHSERFAGVAVWAGTPPPLWDAEQHVVGLLEDPVPGLDGVAVFVWSARDDPFIDRAALALLTRGLRTRRLQNFGAAAVPPPRAAPAPAELLLIEDETGGHGYGVGGPGAGLQFLRVQRRPRPP